MANETLETLQLEKIKLGDTTKNAVDKVNDAISRIVTNADSIADIKDGTTQVGVAEKVKNAIALSTWDEQEGRDHPVYWDGSIVSVEYGSEKIPVYKAHFAVTDKKGTDITKYISSVSLDNSDPLKILVQKGDNTTSSISIGTYNKEEIDNKIDSAGKVNGIKLQANKDTTASDAYTPDTEKNVTLPVYTADQIDTKILALNAELGNLAGGMRFIGTISNVTETEGANAGLLPTTKKEQVEGTETDVPLVVGDTFKVSKAGWVFYYVDPVNPLDAKRKNTIEVDVGDLLIYTSTNTKGEQWSHVPSGDDGDVYATNNLGAENTLVLSAGVDGKEVKGSEYKVVDSDPTELNPQIETSNAIPTYALVWDMVSDVREEVGEAETNAKAYADSLAPVRIEINATNFNSSAANGLTTYTYKGTFPTGETKLSGWSVQRVVNANGYDIITQATINSSGDLTFTVDTTQTSAILGKGCYIYLQKYRNAFV